MPIPVSAVDAMEADGEFHAIVHRQLAIDRIGMVFDRLFRYLESLANLLIGKPGGNQARHFDLSGSKRFHAVSLVLKSAISRCDRNCYESGTDCWGELHGIR
jgi:hypothetical protein